MIQFSSILHETAAFFLYLSMSSVVGSQYFCSYTYFLNFSQCCGESQLISVHNFTIWKSSVCNNAFQTHVKSFKRFFTLKLYLLHYNVAFFFLSGCRCSSYMESTSDITLFWLWLRGEWWSQGLVASVFYKCKTH